MISSVDMEGDLQAENNNQRASYEDYKMNPPPLSEVRLELGPESGFVR